MAGRRWRSGAPTPTATLTISGATTTAPINNLPFAITLEEPLPGQCSIASIVRVMAVMKIRTSTPLSSFITPGILYLYQLGVYTALAEVGRGGATTTTTTVITVLAGTTIGGLSLGLDFSVSPSTGVAPLTNVGFTGTVSGTAITVTATTAFSFDCLNDGSFEFSSSTLSTTMTQGNLCSYTLPGTYVARLLAVRESFMVSATTSVVVSPIPAVPPPSWRRRGGRGGGGGTPTVTVSTGGGGPIGLLALSLDRVLLL